MRNINSKVGSLYTGRDEINQPLTPRAVQKAPEGVRALEIEVLRGRRPGAYTSLDATRLLPKRSVGNTVINTTIENDTTNRSKALVVWASDTGVCSVARVQIWTYFPGVC